MFVLEGLWSSLEGTDTDLKKNARAKAKLPLSVDPINYIHIRNATSAHEAWNKLHTVFEENGISRRTYDM
uniref:Uncharacterized protein n=1 Tax=Megaselia scalaris TaxID=36166 RepID=T1GUB7_MEGSC